MSDTLLPCPYCGNEPIPTGAGAKVMCNNLNCPIYAREFSPWLWNRRYVCLDKNGDKVYSDSHFRIWGKDTLCFVWDVDFLRWRTKWIDGKSKGESCDAIFACFEIELVKEPT